MMMTTISDAQPGDIYVDANGKIWRITSVVREPTIEAEEVEGVLDDPNAPVPVMAHAQAQAFGIHARRASIRKRIQRALINDAVWHGWQRVFRRAA